MMRQMVLRQDSQTAKLWKQINKITALLRKHDKRTEKKNGTFGAVVLAKGKRVQILCDRDYQSSYDQDDSIGMRMFADMRTDRYMTGSSTYMGKRTEFWHQGTGWRFAGIVTCEKWGKINSYKVHGAEGDKKKAIALAAIKKLHTRLTGQNRVRIAEKISEVR
ncbi:MAG TPA: hypothetical protein VIX91_26625 [Candidatus Acidoferrum sp.]